MIMCSLPLNLILFLIAMSLAVSFIIKGGGFELLAVGCLFGSVQMRIFILFRAIWILFLALIRVRVFFFAGIIYFFEISPLIFIYTIDSSFIPSPY